MAIKRINVPNGNSGLSFRNVQSGSSQSSQGLRSSQRIRDFTSQEQQSSAYQVKFAPRSFFVEDEFNDITIEELAQFMEREEDFVEETSTETEEQQSQQQQAPPPQPEQPVDQRKVAAVAAYDWFATL